MASTTTSGSRSSSCSSFIPLPTPPLQNFISVAIPRQIVYSEAKWSNLTISHPPTLPVNHIPRSLTSSTPTIEEDEREVVESDGLFLEPETPTLNNQDPYLSSSMRGCKACGREEIESGCNGEGRIQGGIATFPGFGWWPIKAYRPCPGLVASGGRYRRTGQSMDEVVSGRGASMASVAENKSRKKKHGQKKFKQ